jgi:hypothetical protein
MGGRTDSLKVIYGYLPSSLVCACFQEGKPL